MMNQTFSGKKPIKLSPDLFTPQTRTPWGGTHLSRSYKASFADSGQVIGESWEFSCDPALPSKVVGADQNLLSLMESHQAEIFGGHPNPRCEILVKLLNADAPLSVQVHPEDNDPHLKAGECGKPESWLILDREPGAGLYLGFSQAYQTADIQRALAEGTFDQSYLQFVPVEPGDYFEIQPGVPHAIGPGVTLLEPQRVRPGEAGKTYRFWDWGKRYDDHGKPDPKGLPRALHVEESLRVINPQKQWGKNFADTLRRTPHIEQKTGSYRWHHYPSNPYYQVHDGTFHDAVQLDLDHGFCALISLSGEAQLGSGDSVVMVSTGEPALLPAQAFPIKLVPQNEYRAVLITQSQSKLSYPS